MVFRGVPAVSAGKAVRAALAAASLFFGGLFGQSAGAQTVTADGVTVCTFGNPDREDDSRNYWYSGEGWAVLSKICYDRRLGVGLQAGKGAMYTAFGGTPQQVAWVEVTGCVTSQIGAGHEVTLDLQLDEAVSVGTRQLESAEVFVFGGPSQAVTVRYVLEEPMLCERMILASGELNVSVLTVMQVRWGGTAEAVKVSPSLPQAVMPGQTFTVSVSCTGGTGTYTALGWSLGGTEGTVDLEGGSFAAGETVSFSVTAPAQPGAAELTVTAVDTAGAEGRAAAGLTVVNAGTVNDLTLTALSVTGLTAAWTPPVPAPERIRVSLSRTESGASVTVPEGESADLALWPHTGGWGGWLIPQGVLAEAAFAYSFNGGETKTVAPGMWIPVPAEYPQSLRLSELPDTVLERTLKLSFDPISLDADPGSGTCSFSGVPLAGQSVTVTLETCYNGTWWVAAQVGAEVPPLAPPAAVTARDDGSGGRIVEASREAGGLYGIVCDVLLERMEEPGDRPRPTGLVLSRAYHTDAYEPDFRAVVLSNASGEALSLEGYTLWNINAAGTSSDELDLGLLEPNVLPPYGELYVAYRPASHPEYPLFPDGAEAPGPSFGSGNGVLRYYGSRRTELRAADGTVLSSLPSYKDGLLTLSADGMAYVETPWPGRLPESFFEPWAGLPAWQSERAASQIGPGVVAFGAETMENWLRASGVDRIRAEVRTYEPQLGQVSEASRSVLLWPLQEPAESPGYLLRLR